MSSETQPLLSPSATIVTTYVSNVDPASPRCLSASSTLRSSIEEQKTTKKDIFSRRQKIFIVTCVSLAGFFSPFAINIYIPALPSVARDLNVSEAVATLTVTIYMVFQGLSPAFWAPLADAYGRRPMYISTFFVFIIACIGLAKSNTITSMLILRALQASGASSVISIGSGTIGDISKPSERGSFMGYFALGQFLGPCVGPVLGGALAHRYGYHAIFWFLTIFAGVFTVFILVFLPETLPRVVGHGYIPKKYLSLHQLISRDRKIALMDAETEQPAPISDEGESGNTIGTPAVLKRTPAPNFSDISFLEPYKYLAEWDILLICTMYAINYGAYYAMSTSQSTLFTSIYKLSTFEVGLTFIPSGFGCALGSVIGGQIVDRHYQYYLVKMKSQAFTSGVEVKEFPIERARLRALPWYLAIYTSALMCYGWSLRTRMQLAIPLALQFIIGYCSTSMFGNLNTLLVDLYPSNPSSATATNNFTRCLFGAITTASITGILNSTGEGWTFVLIGLLCLAICCPSIWALRTWGYRPRSKRAAKITKLI